MMKTTSLTIFLLSLYSILNLNKTTYASIIALPPTSSPHESLITNSIDDLSCQSEIKDIFTSQQIPFTCQNSCVTVSKLPSLTLSFAIPTQPFPFIFVTPPPPIQTCVIFSEITSLTFSAISLVSNSLSSQQQNPVKFLNLTSITTLTIETLTIKDISLSNQISSILSINNTDTTTINSISFSSSTTTYPTILPTVLALISISTQNLSINTLSLVDFPYPICFQGTNNLLIQSLIFNETFIDQTAFSITSLLTLNASTRINISTITIVQKSDELNYINIDLTINPINIPNQNLIIEIDNIQLLQPIAPLNSQTGFIIQIGSILPPTSFPPNSLTQVTIKSINVSIAFSQIDQLNGLTLNAGYMDSLSIQSINSVNFMSNFIQFIGIRKIQISNFNYSTKSASPAFQFLQAASLQASQISELNLSNITVSYLSINDTYSPLFYLYNITTLSIDGLQLNNSNITSPLITSVLIGNLTLSNLVVSNTPVSQSPLFQIQGCGSLTTKNFNYSYSPAVLPSSSQLSSTQSTYLISTNSTLNVTASNILANFAWTRLGFISSDFLNSLSITASNFQYCYSQQSGGCVNVIVEKSYPSNLIIANSSFSNSISYTTGGAISGGNIMSLINSTFTNCSSRIGGAIFANKNTSAIALSNGTYANNVAYIARNDFTIEVDGIRTSNVYEYNPTFKDTQIYKIKLETGALNSNFYVGLMYIVQIELRFGSTWISNMSANMTASSLANVNFNMYPYLLDNRNFDSSVIPGFPSLHLIFISTQLPAYYNQNLNKIIFSLGSQNSIAIVYTPIFECKNGMETVHVENQYETFCKYCDFSKALYLEGNVTEGDCATCNTMVFSQCFANHTKLQKGFWRSKYSIQSEDIELCSIFRGGCNGGDAIGNELCYQGHVGPQCLDCDIRGQFWNTSYSRYSAFSCQKCSDITSNDIKIIFSFGLLSLSLLVIINSNFKNLLNNIYAHYLSRMNIIYFGTSLHRLQQTSTLMKILLFNLFFAHLSNSITQVNYLSSLENITISLSRPLDSQLFSLDCFLIEKFPDQFSIGFSNLLVSLAIPVMILTVIMLVLALLVIKKKLSLRRSAYVLELAFIYLFMIIFQSVILELCLKSLSCIVLSGSNAYSLIDLSIDCSDTDEISKIQALSIPVLIFMIIIPIGMLLLLFAKRKQLNKISVMFTYGFLYKEYRQIYFYWEFVRTSLRIMCIIVSVKLIQYPRAYCSIISILLVIYLAVLISKQPFNQKQFNTLEVLSIAVAILNMQTALLFQDQSNDIDDDEVSIVQLLFVVSQLLNLCFVLWLAFLIICSFFVKSLQKTRRHFSIRAFDKYLPLYSPELRSNMAALRRAVSKIDFQYVKRNRLMGIGQSEQLDNSQFGDSLGLVEHSQCEKLIFQSKSTDKSERTSENNLEFQEKHVTGFCDTEEDVKNQLKLRFYSLELENDSNKAKQYSINSRPVTYNEHNDSYSS